MGSSSADTAYGLYQCIGDLSMPDCTNCVARAVSQIGTLFSNAYGGVLEQQGCFVKYDNTKFLGVEDKAISMMMLARRQFLTQEYENIYGFLFDLEKLQSMSDDSLLASCTKLEDYLSYGTLSDIDGRDLYTELKIMKRTLPA
ncbi:hypothetical protein C5167_028472 [Papaver somniferum]|nr:hypothetical protein C5167_028472 [Papaver somniferum]